MKQNTLIKHYIQGTHNAIIGAKCVCFGLNYGLLSAAASEQSFVKCNICDLSRFVNIMALPKSMEKGVRAAVKDGKLIRSAKAINC